MTASATDMCGHNCTYEFWADRQHLNAGRKRPRQECQQRRQECQQRKSSKGVTCFACAAHPMYARIDGSSHASAPTAITQCPKQRAPLRLMAIISRTLHVCCLVAIFPLHVRGQTPAPATVDAASSATETPVSDIGAALGPLNILLSGFAESFARPVKGILPTSSFYTPGSARMLFVFRDPFKHLFGLYPDSLLFTACRMGRQSSSFLQCNPDRPS